MSRLDWDGNAPVLAVSADDLMAGPASFAVGSDGMRTFEDLPDRLGG